MNSELSKNVYDLVKDLKNIDISILKGRLERGNILQRIKTGKAYINYDSYCSTWHEFLEAVHLNRETARQDMEIYNEFSYFVLEQSAENLRQTSYERLVRLLPIVKKDPEKKRELFEMATRSNRADFDNNVRELKGLVATDSCENCMQEFIVLHKCKCCGLTIKK
jgi:hypothetical protein|tara:strand:- start:244 stop:738 length:495 start_codon:yes stop_codon:yes gene_type:complete